jgi:hypothetical protein
MIVMIVILTFAPTKDANQMVDPRLPSVAESSASMEGDSAGVSKGWYLRMEAKDGGKVFDQRSFLSFECTVKK